MPFPPVFKHHQVDVSNLQFGEAKPHGPNGKTIEIYHTDPATGAAEKLWLQLPKMRIPFGVASSAQYSDRITNPTYSIELSLQGLRGGEGPMVEFAEFLEGLEAKIIEKASAESVQWFGRERTVYTVQELFKPLLKHDPDHKYDPKMRVKLPKSWGRWEFLVFNQNRDKADVDDLQPGSDLVAVVEVDNVWVLNGSLGVSFKAKQLQVFRREELNQFIIS